MKNVTPSAVSGIADNLKKKLKKDGFLKGDIYLRLHRAISWLRASEEYNSNSDIAFLCLWISFNSCYAVDDLLEEKNGKKKKEGGNIIVFLKKLAACDETQRIYNFLWHRYSNEIRLVLDNEFLFTPFWEFHRGERKEYKAALRRSVDRAQKHLQQGNVPGLLAVILHRLYILRNQIFHGAATYKGSKNRMQIKHASTILSRLLPIVIEIMIDNKEKSWGSAYYPVINK